jgi:hypothetical protein
MEAGVRLAVVGSQGEADVICSLLPAHGIECRERATNLDFTSEFGQGGGWGGQREVLVSRADFDLAQELIGSPRD